ncbi:MAG: hypothetical protein IJH65_05180 [Methanobrevibacter sp.]|nr:hypothetical protein [Methanobrevibacter sp.]
MNKKLLAIGFIIIAILILGFCFYTYNTVKIGNAYFTVPEGYHVVDREYCSNITSETDHMCLVKEVSDDNINNVIEKYNAAKVSENDTLNFSKFSFGEVEVIKSISNKNPNVIHYWFVKDGMTYEAFTWDGDSNSDSLLKNLIHSMKPAIDVF